MSLFKNARVIFFFGMLFLSFPTFGQSQNDSLQYNVNLNLTGRMISGTFNQLVAGGGLNVDLLFRNWHLENKTTYRYNETNTRLIEDNWYDLVTLKYYPKGSRKLFPGLFYHYDNNLIYRVISRHQYGVGLGSILDKGSMELAILAGIANEHSNFNGSEFVNSELDFSSRRNGLFLFRIINGFTLAKKKINFSYQLFYFQSLKESTDYDIWLTPKISFRVIKGLSFHVIYDYRLENVHLETLSKHNEIVLFGFSLALKG